MLYPKIRLCRSYLIFFCLFLFFSQIKIPSSNTFFHLTPRLRHFSLIFGMYLDYLAFSLDFCFSGPLCCFPNHIHWLRSRWKLVSFRPTIKNAKTTHPHHLLFFFIFLFITIYISRCDDGWVYIFMLELVYDIDIATLVLYRKWKAHCTEFFMCNECAKIHKVYVYFYSNLFHKEVKYMKFRELY